jgi:chemotaxis protein methyltransferase CheR
MANEPSSGGFAFLSDEDYQTICELLSTHFGIMLGEAKRPMVTGRLQALRAQFGLSSFGELCDLLRRDRSGRALSSLVNRLSTNTSFFYREEAQFRFFEEVAFPEALTAAREAGSRDLRIWCAGCSTGEEPYMLVVLMMERLGADYRNWDAGVLATDISDEVLAVARLGVYPLENVRRVPRALRDKYLQALGREQWRVSETVRKEVTYRKFNLVTPGLPFRMPFHVIFCRNVMIYFDPEVKRSLVERLYGHTVSGGYLFIGQSETLRDLSTRYQFVQPGIYRRPREEAGPATSPHSKGLG